MEGDDEIEHTQGAPFSSGYKGIACHDLTDEQRCGGMGFQPLPTSLKASKEIKTA
jgi:hypothetical protein